MDFSVFNPFFNGSLIFSGHFDAKRRLVTDFCIKLFRRTVSLSACRFHIFEMEILFVQLGSTAFLQMSCHAV